MRRILIIDGQILQTGAWYRGMGKYLIQILKQLNDNVTDDLKIVILFNSKLSMDESRRRVMRVLLPGIECVEFDLPLPSEQTDEAEAKKYQQLLTEHIKQHYSDWEVSFLLTSLFLFDFFAEFPNGCRRYVLFYDLTPLLFWKDLGGYFPPGLYMPRFSKILEADHVFAISETTRQDLLRTFGLAPSCVSNINGGFIKIAQTSNRPKSFDVPRHYVLFPTGDLPHKNNDLAVKGFAQYLERSQVSSSLLVTSQFSSASKDRLQDIGCNIIFTQNVSDEELEWLYEHADAVLFASKYEGLGMPVLDAVANKKPVIASRIPVFEEMSKNAFHYFNPASSNELADALSGALAAKNKPRARLQDYDGIMKKYTWEQSARKLLHQVTLPIPKPAAVRVGTKPRIAIACLHPGIAAQIGRLAEPLFGQLSEAFEVDFYFDANGVHYRSMERPTFLDFLDCKTFDIASFNIAAYRSYGAVVYLYDSTALPSRLAQKAAVLPGLIVKGSLTNLDYLQNLMEQAIADNAIEAYDLSDWSTAAASDLKEIIQAQVSALKQSNTQRLLNGKGSQRSIIKKLKAQLIE